MTGHGKVILLGEHAVVYGHPALAGALGLGVSAVASPSTADRLEIPGWSEAAPWMTDDQHPVARAFAAVKQAMGLATPFAVAATATVPPRAGLGSSAALAVALVRALATATGRVVDDAEVERLAAAAERVFHGTPSGIDVALATRGGMGLYRRASGLERIAAPPLTLAIGLSGEPRDTAARVADVAARLAARPDETHATLARLGELALEGRAPVERGDAAALAPLFDEAHAHLARLGLSSPGLERLCDLARALRAGAKLTGAGGGGAVIAVLPGREEELVAAWRGAGFAARVAVVGRT